MPWHNHGFIAGPCHGMALRRPLLIAVGTRHGVSLQDVLWGSFDQHVISLKNIIRISYNQHGFL